MSMETVSKKRNRIYKRLFDHEEALRMYKEEGFLVAEIARHMGVSIGAVNRVVNPKYRARLDSNLKRWIMSGVCKGCGGPRSRTAEASSDPERRAGFSGFCRSCWSRSKQTRFHVDAHDNAIEVRCCACRQWYPAERFPKSKAGTRGFHTICTPCSSAMRRKYRERRRIPCAICGKLATHPDDKKSRGGLPYARCQSCAGRGLVPGDSANIARQPKTTANKITEEELEKSARRDAQWARKGA